MERSEDTMQSFSVEGDASRNHCLATICLSCCCLGHTDYNFGERGDTVDLKNDPRLCGENVISKLFSTISIVVISSTLLASLAFSAVPSLEDYDSESEALGWELLNVSVIYSMTFVVLLNLFCVIVLAQQMYLLTRVMTYGVGGNGPDMALILYKDPTFATLRHAGTSAFFVSIPLFVVAALLMVYEQVANYGAHAIVAAFVALLIVVFFGALLLVCQWQERIFYHRCAVMTDMHKPLRTMYASEGSEVA
uniref:Uncharacterized protein n=1 Tax=Noctiluca scintillans TaxID=2966 RepID=A0A7S1B1J1_NOCSC|mmetsp:Transcript_8712/g.24332  ORF Transcript_8712/g.24332 Transcript_8712/m.24332 type:complete len:250 (+) Transcript_8712:86-835(+)